MYEVVKVELEEVAPLVLVVELVEGEFVVLEELDDVCVVDDGRAPIPVVVQAKPTSPIMIAIAAIPIAADALDIPRPRSNKTTFLNRRTRYKRFGHGSTLLRCLVGAFSDHRP